MRRWGHTFPPRDKARQVASVSEDWVPARLKDTRWIATARERLQSLIWFMKCLKEPLSRLANREEQTRRAFFEGRFKSVAILDEESRLRRWRGQGNNGWRRRAGAWGARGKAAKRWLDQIGSARTNPLRSRSCHQEENRFQRRSQDSGNPVVESVCRDCADVL